VLDVAKVFKLDWQTVKALIRSTGPDRSACRHAQAEGHRHRRDPDSPGPQLSHRVSGLIRKRPISPLPDQPRQRCPPERLAPASEVND